MAAIYRDAYITIAATQCSSTLDGLFPSDVEVKSASEQGLQLSALRTVQNPPFIMGMGGQPPQEEILQLFPLLTRAWVFQERLLSTRVLHFGPQELCWECKSTMVTQTMPKMGNLRIKWEPYFLTHFITKPSHDYYITSTDSSPRQRWASLVEEYTKLRLTYISDRLPAISGLAASMYEAQPGRYLAGLWSDTIFQDMTWRALSAEEPITPWQAPSWSWASVRSEITYEAREKGWMPSVIRRSPPQRPIPEAQLLEVDIVSKGPNEMGPLLAASLKVRGELFPAHLKSLSEDALYGRGSIYWDTKTHTEYKICYWTVTKERKCPSCNSVPLYHIKLFPPSRSWNWCLILEPISFEKAEYKRIGVTGMEVAYAEGIEPEDFTFL